MNGGTLRLLLHKYCFGPAMDSDFVCGSKEFLDECHVTLARLDLIEHAQNGAKITEKGRTHVDALLKAPLPVLQWVSPLTASE